MRFFRIGDKIVSREKLVEQITGILRDRERGATQADTAKSHGVERSFVSWLETLGEVRRGRRVGLIAFPVANGDEVRALAEAHGVEFLLVMSQSERESLEGSPGDQVFNRVLDTLATLKDFDVLVLLASDWRVGTIEKILGREVVALTLGPSPLRHDVVVDLAQLDDILDGVTAPDIDTATTKARSSARAKAGELLRTTGRWTRSKK
ncbi:MAG: transcriptional regulator [Coriobacteriia bacterium]|nr:transcriptional regulator [Coriobacteriia bacterium]